jgi:ABC-2 type transport system permease protein
MAGAFLAIASFISALTKNQVIAFILAATVCFLFVMSGTELVQNTIKTWAPEAVANAFSSMSVLSHFDSISRGVVNLGSLVFFLSLIALALFANAVAVDQKKAS